MDVYGPSYLTAAVVFSLVLSLGLTIAAIKWRLTVRSVLVCLLVAVISYVILVIYPAEFFPYPQIGTIHRAANTWLWLLIWIYSRSLWQLGAFFFSVAGLSNSLSAIYPPYRVIDYLWSTPLHETIAMGVFNLADVCWLIAFAVFASALLVTLWRYLLHYVLRLVMGSASPHSAPESES